MTDQPLTLDLQLPEGPVPIGEPLPATVALANRTSDPVLVNGRLLVAPVGTPAPFHEVTFEVRGPDGYVNRTRAHVNSGKPRDAQFVVLAPGEARTKEFDLTSMHSMHTPGRYDVQATYANTIDQPDRLRRPWIGSVSSDWGAVERR